MAASCALVQRDAVSEFQSLLGCVADADFQFTEGRGFKSHLGLGFFPSSPYI